MKKHCLAFAATLFVPYIMSAQAHEICPSIESIKNGRFQGWTALYNPSDTPASATMVSEFETSITEFYTAEWSSDYSYGQARCYYYSNTDVSLAKATPLPRGINWHAVGNRYQCRSALPAACLF